MRKVLLINTNLQKGPYPIPPIGLSILAESLKQQYEVKIYDGAFDRKQKTLIKTIDEYQPDYVGVTIRNIDNTCGDNSIYYVDMIYEKFIKKIKSATQVPMILGGSGFSILPVDFMKVYQADYGIVGEGEHTLLALLEALDQGRKVSDIHGVITGGQEKAGVNSRDSNPSFINTAQIPMSMMDEHINLTPYFKFGSVYSIQAKRGCARKCIYCVYPALEGAQCRLKDPKVIADEIEQAYHRLHYHRFEFIDSIFNDPLDFAKEVCREIIRRDIKVSLTCSGITPANVDEELIELMLEAGFHEMSCTPDSGSAKMIKNMGKGFTLEQLIDTAALIRKYDIPSGWFFLLGGPGENRATVEETFDFIKNHTGPLDLSIIACGIRIYPHTPLYRTALKEHYIEPDKSLLQPVFYFSKEIGGPEGLNEVIYKKLTDHPNCSTMLQVTNTSPMIMGFIIKKIFKIQKRLKLKEPPIRTMLRIRQWMYRKKGMFKRKDFLKEVFFQSMGFNNDKLMK